MIRAILVLVAILALSVACSSSNNSGDDPGKQIRAVADEMIARINARDYAGMLELGSSKCGQSVSSADLEAAWSATGTKLGDPNFRLEIRDFRLKEVSGSEAQVAATVVAVTKDAEVPFGSEQDPFFDLFEKEDGKWKVGDPSCEASPVP